MSYETTKNVTGATSECLETTMNAGPDWGPHPPRRTQRATALWVWMINEKLGRWLTFMEIFDYVNSRWRNGMSSQQLGNLLAKNKRAFERGPGVRVHNGFGPYEVRLWRAIGSGG